MSLAPPSTVETFTDLDLLLQYINGKAITQGYAIITRHSKSKASCKYKVYFECDRGGTYMSRNPNPHKKPRLTGTRLTECPFSLVADFKENVWRLRLRNGSHNHEPSWTPIAHPTHRKLTVESLTIVQQMTDSGGVPRLITGALRENGLQVKSKDIYNVRSKIQSTNLGSSTPIEAMFQHMANASYMYFYKQDSLGHITHIFFAHRQSLTLLREYPHLLLMDCMYKTNRFKLPLLNIVRVTSINTTFYVVFCFIKNKTEEDYIWTLTQL